MVYKSYETVFFFFKQNLVKLDNQLVALMSMFSWAYLSWQTQCIIYARYEVRTTDTKKKMSMMAWKYELLYFYVIFSGQILWYTQKFECIGTTNQ